MGVLTYIIFLFFCSGSFSKNEYPETRRVLIINDTCVEEVSVLVAQKADVQLIPSISYHWYREHYIGINQGGYSGVLLHGSYKRYAKGGKLLKSGMFHMGVKQGLWILWDDKGNMKSEESYEQGLKHGKVRLYEDGILQQEEDYVKGHLHGKLKRYQNGQLIEELKYKQGRQKEEKEKTVDSSKEKKSFFKKKKVSSSDGKNEE